MMKYSDEDLEQAAKIASKAYTNGIGIDLEDLREVFVEGAIWAKNWLEDSESEPVPNGR